MSREIKYTALRFHQPIFVLGVQTANFTPATHPNIKVRLTDSGQLELVKLNKKTGMNSVAQIGEAALLALEYDESAE